MCIPLETGREMSLWRAFLACIAASANKFIFIDMSHIVFIIKLAMDAKKNTGYKIHHFPRNHSMSRKENKKLSCNHVIFSTDKGVK
jgi:hypothetical protein